MSCIALRVRLRRWRHHGTALAVMLALLAAVALHHAAPAIGGAHHHSDLTAMAELCLGVFTAVGAAAVAVVLGLIARSPWAPVPPFSSDEERAAPPPEPRARAGPALLTVLCVSRC